LDASASWVQVLTWVLNKTYSAAQVMLLAVAVYLLLLVMFLPLVDFLKGRP
jgi:hypothetical protein